MDINTIFAQAKSQIDKDFPIKRRKVKMTALHRDAILLVSTSSKPVRMRQLVSLLCGEHAEAPNWTGRVCDLVDALCELRDARVLRCEADGWTKP